jgi:hypothetical protein
MLANMFSTVSTPCAPDPSQSTPHPHSQMWWTPHHSSITIASQTPLPSMYAHPIQFMSPNQSLSRSRIHNTSQTSTPLLTRVPLMQIVPQPILQPLHQLPNRIYQMPVFKTPLLSAWPTPQSQAGTYLVEWAIASHGMYKSHPFVIFLFLLFQWTCHEGNTFGIMSHC